MSLVQQCKNGGQQKSKVSESKVVQEKDDTRMSEGMQARDRKQENGSKSIQERENAHSRERTRTSRTAVRAYDREGNIL